MCFSITLGISEQEEKMMGDGDLSLFLPVICPLIVWSLCANQQIPFNNPMIHFFFCVVIVFRYHIFTSSFLYFLIGKLHSHLMGLIHNPYLTSLAYLFFSSFLNHAVLYSCNEEHCHPAGTGLTTPNCRAFLWTALVRSFWTL